MKSTFYCQPFDWSYCMTHTVQAIRHESLSWVLKSMNLNLVTQCLGIVSIVIHPCCQATWKLFERETISEKSLSKVLNLFNISNEPIHFWTILYLGIISELCVSCIIREGVDELLETVSVFKNCTNVHWLDSDLIPRLLENYENWKNFMVIFKRQKWRLQTNFWDVGVF